MLPSIDAAAAARRWTFERVTPLGATRCVYEMLDDALRFESDDPIAAAGVTVRWDRIREGGTASMAGMTARGGPDLPGWVPEQLEWLALSHTVDPGHEGSSAGFMRPLPPPGSERDAIVAAVRERLGSRWIGEGIALKDAQRRLSISSDQWSGSKVFGIVVAVLALLALSVIALAFLLLPAALVAGGFMLRRGLYGWRDSIGAASVPLTDVARARPGLVHLEAPALAGQPTTAAFSGRRCVWWDVAVFVWYEGSADTASEWRQMAARHGGARDTLQLGTADGGQLAVWLKDAELLLERRSWESRRDELPATGLALLDALGFSWQGQRLKVTEECVEDHTIVYVLGTLGQRRDVSAALENAPRLERLQRTLRSGQWRRSMTAALPRALRPVLAVFIGLLDMLTGLGFGKARPTTADPGPPPALAPGAQLVWKGRDGYPLLVSDQPEGAALAGFRQRSLSVGGIGAAIFCYAVYLLAESFAGR